MVFLTSISGVRLVQVDSRDVAFHPTGQGFVFQDPTGFPVAELLGHPGDPYCELYILYDMIRRGTSRELGIARNLFEHVQNFLEASESSAGEQHPALWRKQYRESQTLALLGMLTANDAEPKSIEVKLQRSEKRFLNCSFSQFFTANRLILILCCNVTAQN